MKFVCHVASHWKDYLTYKTVLHTPLHLFGSIQNGSLYCEIDDTSLLFTNSY